MTRRSFLAASAGLAAGPALAAAPASGEVDVAIVGAGAAGIAAARRIAGANRRFVLVEASNRIGGRCFTDQQAFGMPFDRGAHWIHTPDLNPLTPLAPRTGLDIYPAPPGQKIRIGRRNAREGEMEDFLATMVRAQRAIGDAARGKSDVSCAQAMPKDLGDWRQAVDFVLGPFGCAKDLEDVSAADFSRSAERDVNAFCRQGLGALIAKLGEALPVRLSTPVTQINTWVRGRVELATPRGTIIARAVVVTASTNVLAAGKIKFEPELPKRTLEAIGKLRLGSYDHIVLELPGNPLGLQSDDLVFERANGPRTAAMLANVSGTPLCMIDVGGKFGRDLAAQGEPAMIAFAQEWLAGLFGNDVKKAVRRVQATRWSDDPWALGAFSAAAPGGQWARLAMLEPVRDRVFFAGEAVHETMWGTVGGAWQSGERAAEAALRKLGLLAAPREPAPAKPAKPRQQPRPRAPDPSTSSIR